MDLDIHCFHRSRFPSNHPAHLINHINDITILKRWWLWVRCCADDEDPAGAAASVGVGGRGEAARGGTRWTWVALIVMSWLLWWSFWWSWWFEDHDAMMIWWVWCQLRRGRCHEDNETFLMLMMMLMLMRKMLMNPFFHFPNTPIFKVGLMLVCCGTKDKHIMKVG